MKQDKSRKKKNEINERKYFCIVLSYKDENYMLYIECYTHKTEVSEC